jgi:hypothetical protein
MSCCACYGCNEAHATRISFFYQPSLPCIGDLTLIPQMRLLVLSDAPVIHRMIHGFYAIQIYELSGLKPVNPVADLQLISTKLKN